MTGTPAPLAAVHAPKEQSNAKNSAESEATDSTLKITVVAVWVFFSMSIQESKSMLEVDEFLDLRMLSYTLGSVHHHTPAPSTLPLPSLPAALRLGILVEGG